MVYVPDLGKIRQVLSTMPNIKVIVVGDIMLDEHLVYREKRRDKQKWYQTHEKETIYKVDDESIQVGGAATVARAIEDLTGKVYLFGVLGKDDRSKVVQQLMKKHKKIKPYFYFSDARYTTRKLRLFEEQPLRPVCQERFDTETTTDIPEELTRRMLKCIRGIMSRNTKGEKRTIVVIIQDFEKGVITPRMVEELAQLCSRTHILLVVDPKYNWNKYKHHPIYAVVPNQEETMTALRKQGNFLPDHEYELLSHYQTIKNFVITRSTFGARVIMRKKNGTFDSRDFRGHKFALEPTSVVGCGDVFTGVFACLLARGCSILDSCAVANLAAAMQANKPFGEFVAVGDIGAHLDEIRRNIRFSVREENITFVNHIVKGLTVPLDLSAASFAGLIASPGTRYRRKLEAIKKFLLSKKGGRLLLIGEPDTGKSHVVRSISKSLGFDLMRIPSQTLIGMKPHERYALIQGFKNKAKTRGVLFIDEYLSRESDMRCYLEKDTFVCDLNDTRLTLSTDDLFIVAVGSLKEWDAISDKGHTKIRFDETIKIPKLSDHVEDVPYLIFQKLKKLGRPSMKVSTEAIITLALYIKRTKKGFKELFDIVESFPKKAKIVHEDLQFEHEKIASQQDKSFVELRTNDC